MASTATDPMEELAAMTAVAQALAPLDAEATARVVRWATERFGKISLPRIGAVTESRTVATPDAYDASGFSGQARFEHLADLYGAASPSRSEEHPSALQSLMRT